MIIRRHRRFTIKMGEYEMYAFGADVELSHHDLGHSDTDVVKMSSAQRKALGEALTEAVLVALDEQLIEEVQESAELTEHKRSFILRAITKP